VLAAIHSDPNEAVGLAGALRELQQQPWGWVPLGVVALGLAAFGLFDLAQALYIAVSRHRMSIWRSPTK
jgi:hypothetical protein